MIDPVPAGTSAAPCPTTWSNELQTWLDGQQWPENVQLRFRGADEEQKESMASSSARPAAGSLFLMFIILLTQYNSFYQTDP